MIDLQKFCCKNPELLQSMGAPFTQDGRTWATNGWVMIGVPVVDSIPENDKAPRVSKVIPKKDPVEWFDIPPLLTLKECKVCNGKIIDSPCYECGGSGYVNLRNDYSEYWNVGCASCEEEGKIPFCPNCSGTGFFAEEMVQIGNAVFAMNALYMVKDLPGIQISPTGKTTVAHLKFDDGVGYLMPAKDNGKR